MIGETIGTARDSSSGFSTPDTNKRTRLCIVLGSHWAAQMGGAQYQAKCLLDALKSLDLFEIFYVAQVVPDNLKQDGYEIVPFGPRKLGFLRRLRPLLSLYRSIRKVHPTVVYQRSLMPYTGVCALYCSAAGAKLVFHIAHDNDVRRPSYKGWGPTGLLRRFERRIAEFGLLRADAIIAQTQYQARTLKAEYGLDAALVVPNFHPMPAESRSHPRGDRVRVLWVANFKASKNPEIFVELAAAFSDDPRVEFVMIGRPGEAGHYSDLHRRIVSLSNLQYLGELPIERVNEELTRSHIFVNTSTAEGFPNTFIQAWFRGVPVVSCFVDPDECLTKGGAGILVGNAGGLAPAIRRLTDDRSSLEELSRRAESYGYSHHGTNQAQELIRLLSDMGKGTQQQGAMKADS